MFFLGCFTLVSYRLSGGLDSVANYLAMIFLAFVAFIPTIRSELPALSYITFTDFTIFMSLFACLIALLEAFLVDLGLTEGIYTWIMFGISSVLLGLPVLMTIYLWIGYKIRRKGYDNKELFGSSTLEKFQLFGFIPK